MGTERHWFSKDGDFKDGEPHGIIRLHWFDLMAFGIALAVIIRVVGLLWPQEKVTEDSLIQLEVFVEGIPVRQGQCIKEGHWIQDGQTGDHLGKIISKQEQPASKGAWEDGKSAISTLPHQVALTLKIEGRGEVRREDGIYLGRKVIRVGEERTFRTLYAVFPGRVDYLSIIKNGD